MSNMPENSKLTVINATGGHFWPPGLTDTIRAWGMELYVASQDSDTEALCRQNPRSVLIMSRHSELLPPDCAGDMKMLWLPLGANNRPGDTGTSANRDLDVLVAEIEKLALSALLESVTPQPSDSLFLAALIGGMPFGLVVTRQNGDILFANEKYCKSTGYTSDELTGRNISTMCCPVGFNGNIADALPHLSEGKPWIGEMETLHRAGEKVYGQVIVYPIGAKSGGYHYSLFICTPDATDYYHMKHAEQSASLETYGLLAGGIVHDFKNLLQGIGIYTDLLTCEPAEEPEIAAGFIHKLRQEVLRGQAMLDNLMNISRRDFDAPVPVSLHDVIQMLAESLQSLIPNRISLQISLEMVGKVRISSDDLYRILQNLVMNAVLAIDGAGTVTISLKSQQTGPSSGAWAEISVADNGCGMDEITAGRVFEPFYTTRKDKGGSGLGLAVVMSLTVKCGGFVDMHTRPGEGSVFRIILPLITE